MNKDDPDYGAYLRYFGRILTGIGAYSHTIHGVICSCLLLFQLILTIITSIKFWGDQARFIDQLFSAFLMGSTLFIGILIQLNKHLMKEIWRCLGRDLHHYDETEESMQIIREMRKKGRTRGLKTANRFRNFVGLTLTTSTVVRGLLETFVNEQAEFPDENIVANVPFPYWYPINGNKYWIGYILCLTGETFTMFYVAFTTIGFMCSTTLLCDDICTEFQVLSYTFKNFVERAEVLYNMQISKEKNHKTHFETILRKSFNSSVKHHQQLIYVVGRIQRLTKWPLFFLMFEISARLCLSAFSLASKFVPISIKVNSVFVISTTLFQLMMCCLYSQNISDSNQQLSSDIYNARWVEHSKSFKADMLIVQARCMKVMALSAGGFDQINLQTFSRAMQSSYSYFNMLTVFNE